MSVNTSEDCRYSFSNEFIFLFMVYCTCDFNIACVKISNGVGNLIIMHESDCTCYIVSLDNKQNGAKKNFSCHDLFIQNYLFVYFIFLSLM